MKKYEDFLSYNDNDTTEPSIRLLLTTTNPIDSKTEEAKSNQNESNALEWIDEFI